MRLIVGDFYAQADLRDFDVVATDPPFKGSTASNCPVEGSLGVHEFDARRFVRRAEDATKADAALVVFGNFPNASEIMEASRGTSWRYACSQVWDKRPARSWVSWGRPLKHVEHVVYFTRGAFRLDFTTGEVGPPVKRRSFGGGLKASRPNEAKESRAMLGEIVAMAPPRDRVHPTQKPDEWSALLARIVGGPDRRVLDPFCGSGALLSAFPDSVGVDLRDWRRPVLPEVARG